MKKKMKKFLLLLGKKAVITSVVSLTAFATFVAYAAFTEPTSAPGSSNQDFLQNILGANNADNAFDSSTVVANANGSIIERLKYLQNLSTLPAESTVKTGTAYGNQNNGSLTPANGASSPLTATVSDVANGKLFFGSASSTWTSLTGTNVMNQNEYNGSAGTSVLDYAFYPLTTTIPGFLGGVEDYNNNQTSGGYGVMPTGSYSTSWTSCSSGDNCGTNDATYADHKDNATGLVWSKWLDSGNYHTWFWANNCYEPNEAGGHNPGTCVNTGDDACRCVKISSPKVGCDSITGWRTPTQKELMQAYIDGSWGNLPSAYAGFYWSATTYSSYTQYGWYVYLFDGTTSYNAKTTPGSYRVRCVR